MEQKKLVEKLINASNEISKNRKSSANYIHLSEEFIQQEADKLKISFDYMLPCPFCGSEVHKYTITSQEDYDYGKEYHKIICKNWKCYLKNGIEYSSDWDNLVEKWNKRTEE